MYQVGVLVGPPPTTLEPELSAPLPLPALPTRAALEGRLAGAWVSEIEYCWHTAQPSHPNGVLAVDLTGVTFVDQAGWYLLQWMHRDDVRLVGPV
jgi:hypothetical protein